MSNKAPISAKIAEVKAELKKREAKAVSGEIVTKEEVVEQPKAKVKPETDK